MILGIIGMGYVGTALKEGFKSLYKIETFDLNPALRTCDSVKSVFNKSNIIFLSLPTPMKNNGSCDLSIIENTIKKINEFVDSKSDKIIVIKSTIPPGTTDLFNKKYKNLNIIFNPEFLTEANFIDDFINQNRIILGGSEDICKKVKSIYTKVFSKSLIIITQPTYAEMVKYLSNTYLATKVSFANEMKIICDKLDIDYDKVIEYAMHDSRLGESHWSVPGPDGKLGFGGSCFPKDINAIICLASELGIDAKILKSVWNTNLKVRPEKDWEKLKGRAVSENG